MSHMFTDPTTPLTDVVCATFLLFILLTDVQKETVSREQTLWWRFDDELWTRFVYVVYISDKEIAK